MAAKSKTKAYLLDGPGGKWSVWDFGDELTVHAGPLLVSDCVARIPEGIARKMTDADRWHYVTRAASAIHTAKLLGELFGNADVSPTLPPPWQRCRL